MALKFLHESCEVFLERFRREARIMARLEHPAIVRVYDLDSFRGRTYLAMEYIDGGTLALPKPGPRALVAALRRIVDALGFAHEAGVVHRDVKPENVLLDRRGRTYLGDFGLALGPGEGAPRDAARPIVGTPLTMSPEQSRAESVGPASDIFSLGATLYQKLSGRWPFRGRTVIDVLHAIQHEDPEPLCSIAPGVPRSLEGIVSKCLEKSPERRFGSMVELGSALDRALGSGSHRPARPGPRIHPEEIS